MTPTMRWIVAQGGDGPIGPAKVNSPHLAAALARAGVGQVVLPLFVGDRMTGVERRSDPIAELRSPQWLVSHHDARNEPPIRAALDAIAGYLERR
jgi:DNA-binding transcriptional LysR family regulator